MAVIVRKLLHIGALPSELRALLEREGILYLAEYVPVTRRFTGSIPGYRSSHSVAGYTGALVLTDHRVLATLSTMPKLAGRSIDQEWTAQQSGAVKADLSPTGLTLDMDLADVDPRCHGRLSLHYKTPIGDDVLMRLTRRSLAFDVPVEYVLRAIGIPYRP